MNLGFQFYCLGESEIIHSFSMKFFVGKHFPYMSDLDEFIKAASASGLIEKWRSNTNIQSNYRKDKAKITFGLIKLEHIYGVLGIWLSMVTYKILVFLLEIVVHRRAREANPKTQRFWRFLDKMINPDRLFLTENPWV